MVQDSSDLAAPANGPRKDVRPFLSDGVAMMRTNHVPRLRYFWRHARWVRQNKGGLLKANATYVPEYRHFERVTLAYDPPVVGAGDPDPWTPIAKGRLPDGRADVFVFRLGDDEASRERLFRAVQPPPDLFLPLPPPPTVIPEGERVMGLVVLRTYIWVDFDATLSLEPEQRLAILDAYHAMIGEKSAPMFQLIVEAAAGTSSPLARMRVVHHPFFVFGPRPNDATFPEDTEYMKAHLRSTLELPDLDSPEIRPHIHLTVGKSRAAVFPTVQGPAAVGLSTSEVRSFALSRFALGLPMSRNGALVNDLGPADVPALTTKVAVTLDGLLGDKAAPRTLRIS